MRDANACGRPPIEPKQDIICYSCADIYESGFKLTGSSGGDLALFA
jgi:hypothetical protein